MKKLIFILSLPLLYFNIHAQGCSDAGFCTMDSYSTEMDEEENGDSTINNEGPKNLIKVGLAYGSADHGITIISNNINYKRVFSEQWSADLKLNSIAQLGSQHESIGLSDLFGTVNYAPKKFLSISLGFKLPLNNAGNKADGLPLPMDYQSSTGTFDAILGVGFKIQNFRINVGYQQVLVQNNNQFLSSFYDVSEGYANFNDTRKFERQGDVMLRVAYLWKLGTHFEISPSILPIYHLGNDYYYNELDVKTEIEGSEGLTLNGNLFVSYKFKENQSLQLGYSSPFVVRKERPDGLTRSFLLSLEYAIRF